MIKVIKFLYLCIIFTILFYTVALPLMIVTFKFEKSFGVMNNMMGELKKFFDLQSKWEFIPIFEGKVGILILFYRVF